MGPHNWTEQTPTSRREVLQNIGAVGGLTAFGSKKAATNEGSRTLTYSFNQSDEAFQNISGIQEVAGNLRDDYVEQNRLLNPDRLEGISQQQWKDAANAISPDPDDIPMEVLETIADVKTYGASELIDATVAGANLLEAEHLSNIAELLSETSRNQELRSKIENLVQNSDRLQSSSNSTQVNRLFTERERYLEDAYSLLDDYLTEVFTVADEKSRNDTSENFYHQSYLAVRVQISQLIGLLRIDYFATEIQLGNSITDVNLAKAAATELPTQELDLLRFQGKGDIVDTFESTNDYAIYRIPVSEGLAGNNKELNIQVRSRSSSNISIENTEVFLSQNQLPTVDNPSGEDVIRPQTTEGPRLFDDLIKSYEIGSTNPFSNTSKLEPGEYYLLVKPLAPMTYTVHAGVSSLSVENIFGEPVQPQLEDKGFQPQSQNSNSLNPTEKLQNVIICNDSECNGDLVPIDTDSLTIGDSDFWVVVIYPDQVERADTTIEVYDPSGNRHNRVEDRFTPSSEGGNGWGRAFRVEEKYGEWRAVVSIDGTQVRELTFTVNEGEEPETVSGPEPSVESVSACSTYRCNQVASTGSEAISSSDGDFHLRVRYKPVLRKQDTSTIETYFAGELQEREEVRPTSSEVLRETVRPFDSGGQYGEWRVIVYLNGERATETAFRLNRG